MVHLGPLLEQGRSVGVDPGLVVHKIVAGLDRYSHRATLENLFHHGRLLGSSVEPPHISVVRHLVQAASVQLAGDLARAPLVVLGARLWDKADVLRPLRDQLGVATVAALVVLTASQRKLRREGLSLGVVLQNSATRRHHRHRSNSVATSAGPLIHWCGHEVLPVLVPPIKIRGHGTDLLQGPRLMRRHLQEGPLRLRRPSGSRDPREAIELRVRLVEQLGVDLGLPVPLLGVDGLHVRPVGLLRDHLVGHLQEHVIARQRGFHLLERLIPVEALLRLPLFQLAADRKGDVHLGRIRLRLQVALRGHKAAPGAGLLVLVPAHLGAGAV
mmetsp:Transcript_39536/g.94948  ORF Transcript_39536/g.94948 Transcript_39536/m.94948 type:complete len:328 (-) Transcript_39536:441-1424(-)